MGDERVERRLATILVADVVGYSRLVGSDEEGALAALNLHDITDFKQCRMARIRLCA
jgi:class 3 adenylate cyclase